ncbi:MAG: tRNA (adenosine(37)-N6)-dimethylallyltransferase, partial [Candidatus Aminicenantales bacterium]
AREKGLDALFLELEGVDPAYARKIRNRDRVRIVRALEVYRLTRRPLSEHFLGTKSPTGAFNVLKIGLELGREALYRRIEERVDRMFERGLLQEVRGLLARGIPEDAPPFRALGYRHVLACLRGDISVAEAKALTKIDTRHYAKRQTTWFRKMAGVAWFSPDDRRGLEDYLQNRLK